MFKILLIIFIFLGISTASYKWNDTVYEMPLLFELDSYESCLKTSGKYCLVQFELFAEPNNDLMKFIHEYSAVTYKHFNHTVIDRGICVTKSCKSYLNNKDINKQEDLKAILEVCQNATVWKEHGLQTRILEVYYCKTQDTQPQVDAWDWIMVLILMSILMINVVGSLYDYVINHFVRKYDAAIGNKYLLCFSLSKNWTELVTVKKLDETNQRLNIINFAKVVTSTFFIFGHVIMHLSGNYLDNTYDKELEYENPFNYIVFNGMMQVQLFFVITSFLQSFSLEQKTNKEKQNKGTLLFDLVVNRFGRLTPVYLVVMLFCCSWMRFLRTGPLWHGQEFITSQCRRYWWLQLLFLHNYVTEDTYCCIHTWYLAVDFQLFLLGAILFVLTLDRPLLRKCILGVILVTSVGVSAIYAHLKDLSPIMIMNPETIRYSFKKSVEFNYFYKWTHNHFPSYVMGYAYGHIAHNCIEKKIQFKHKIFYLDWLLFPVLLVFLMLGMMFYTEEQPAWPVSWIRVLYGTAHKFAIAGIFGLFGLCVFLGPDERFRKFMTWDGFTVPTRLSYCVYLVHVVVILFIESARTQLMHYSFFDMFMTFSGVMVVSYLISVPLHLMVEVPFSKVVKLWTSSRSDIKKKHH